MILSEYEAKRHDLDRKLEEIGEREAAHKMELSVKYQAECKKIQSQIGQRPTSCDHECSQKLTDNMREIKGYRYKQQKGLCPECGQPFDIKEMELHHVLPWGRFPELRARKANMILLCHKCHKEIHCNPWKNIEMMKAKAEELGIDLKERYDYDDGAGE